MNRDKVTVAQIEVCETAKKMYHSGLVAGTWGNISARVDDEYMVITPSGMDYDRLCPEDMVLVNMNTLEYEGRLKPSVETPIHAAIFKDRPEMNGIVQILGGDVRVADYTMPGSQEMAKTVVEALKDRTGALIANHGEITIGRNLSEALTGSQVLEKAAMVYINVQSIGGPVQISDEDIAFFHDFFLHKYGQK